MSKLLIEESPLTFQPSLAIAIGLNESIVLQQIHYWITNPKNTGYEQDGFKWIYNTYAEWKETNFPFWSENTIQRVFMSLEEKGLVISIQPMKSKYDRTKYYRIEYTKLEAFENTKSTHIDDPKLVSSLDESETTAETTAEPPSETSKKTDESKASYIAGAGLDWALLAGQDVDQKTIDTQRLETEATSAFESAFHISRPWNWYADERTWKDFRRWVVARYEEDRECFSRYFTWSQQPFVKGSMNNVSIKRNPELFPDSFDVFRLTDKQAEKVSEYPTL